MLKIITHFLYEKPLSNLRFHSRKKWKEHLTKNKYDDQNWEQNQNAVQGNINFFKLYPYKPFYENELNDEIDYLWASLAYANYCYCNGDIYNYKRNIELIGKYLDVAVSRENHDGNNIESTIKNRRIYADYLHGKATIDCCMDNRPALASNLNLEASRILSKYTHFSIQSVGYSNCSLCSKIETLSLDEFLILDALDKQSEEIISNIQELKDKAKIDNKESYWCEKIFEAYIMKCKMQLYRTEPDSNIIKKYAMLAGQSLWVGFSDENVHNFGYFANIDKMNLMVVYFYLAFSSMLEDDYENAKKFYEVSWEMNKETKTPYYCLLRIPDEKLAQIANYVQLPKFSKSIEPSKYNKMNSEFRLKTYILIAFCLFCCLFSLLGFYFSNLDNILKKIFCTIFVIGVLVFTYYRYEGVIKKEYQFILDENSNQLDKKILGGLLILFFSILGLVLFRIF